MDEAFELSDAMDWTRQELEDDKDKQDVMVQLVNVQAAIGNFDNAIELMERIPDDCESSPSRYYVIGIITNYLAYSDMLRASQRSKITELEAQQLQVIRQQELIRETFRHEMTNMRLQSKERMRELEQQLVKIRELRSNHVITASVSGVVEQLAIHAVGAVVEPTQTLMVVIPAGARLHAEVFVENKDVGHLVVGQEVALKLDAFPHFKHGLLHGELLDVADDAIEVPNMGLVYPARIGLSRYAVQVGVRSVPLAPGMSVTAEIRTGERPLYEFFLEPLLHHREQALDER